MHDEDVDKLIINANFLTAVDDLMVEVNRFCWVARRKDTSRQIVTRYFSGVCASTSVVRRCDDLLYNQINSGVVNTRNLDLLEKLSPNTNKHTTKALKNKRVLGPSIDESAKEI